MFSIFRAKFDGQWKNSNKRSFGTKCGKRSVGKKRVKFNKPASGFVRTAVKPVLSSQSLETITTYETGLLKLTCPLLEGLPEPTITWFKNDKPLISNGRVTRILSTSYSPAALEIANLQPQDQGLYSCEATNLLGQQRVNIAQVDIVKGGEGSDSLQFYQATYNVSALKGNKGCAATQIQGDSYEHGPDFDGF